MWTTCLAVLASLLAVSASPIAVNNTVSPDVLVANIAAAIANAGNAGKPASAWAGQSAPATGGLDPAKYFHEPGVDNILGHYDFRYFHGVVDYAERTDTLTHMIRAYLQFFRAQGLETWIAHGTLLGWWWNGKMLPWDWDIDTQMSESTLHYIGTNFNQTLHNYTSGDVSRSYFLDVNPWIASRTYGDGMNVIDARWIDIRNGLYIDITGLSEVNPTGAPGVWSCKNNHRYTVKDLYPMRESYYEGVPAMIPYAYEKILTTEYQRKALVEQEFQGHKWDQDTKEWLRKPEGQQAPLKPASAT